MSRRLRAGAMRPGRTHRPSRLAAWSAVVGIVLAVQAVGNGTAHASTPAAVDTGWTEPFAGAPQYEYLGPRELSRPDQLNQPIGQRRADDIARRIGLSKAHVFTTKQYLEFISGGGVGGSVAAAKLVDASVRILTNTVGRPLYSNVNGHLTPTVLASYGVLVNTSGDLESPANQDAPTRKINALLVPGGYLNTWCRNNGAIRTLTMLYTSAYTVEVVYGNKAQQVSEPAQLVTNSKGGIDTEVGMSMVPPIWLVNFALIYTLNPKLAAYMPARWAPIPAPVADALLNSPTGQVPYSQYASYFQ